jgi:hypothetical protein
MVLKLADTICAEIEEQAQAKGSTIVKDVETLQVDADYRLLLSGLMNVMRIKFSVEGGRVTFRARLI